MATQMLNKVMSIMEMKYSRQFTEKEAKQYFLAFVMFKDMNPPLTIQFKCYPSPKLLLDIFTADMNGNEQEWIGTIKTDELIKIIFTNPDPSDKLILANQDKFNPNKFSKFLNQLIIDDSSIYQ